MRATLCLRANMVGQIVRGRGGGRCKGSAVSVLLCLVVIVGASNAGSGAEADTETSPGECVRGGGSREAATHWRGGEDPWRILVLC